MAKIRGNKYAMKAAYAGSLVIYRKYLKLRGVVAGTRYARTGHKWPAYSVMNKLNLLIGKAKKGAAINDRISDYIGRSFSSFLRRVLSGMHNVAAVLALCQRFCSNALTISCLSKASRVLRSPMLC